MTSITSLLVATDFSPDADNAVRRAALLAREHEARLHILHVVKAAGCRPLRDWFRPAMDIGLRTAHARRELQRVALEIARACDVTPTVEVVVGDPFEALLRASDRADVVVLGRRGCGRFGALWAGSPADRLLRTGRRPVLVVRAPVVQPYRWVLAPIDFTTSSDAALRVAARVRHRAVLQVFHAIESCRDAMLRDADVPEQVIRETRLMAEAGTHARMRRKVAGLGLDCAPMSFALAYGPAVETTLRRARHMGADLIVAGTLGRSAVGGFFLESVSRRVLSDAPCDMLIVPRPRDSPSPPAPATAAPGLKSQADSDNAARARSAAAQAGALTQGHWIHNTARFLPRRTP